MILETEKDVSMEPPRRKEIIIANTYESLDLLNCTDPLAILPLSSMNMSRGSPPPNLNCSEPALTFITLDLSTTYGELDML